MAEKKYCEVKIASGDVWDEEISPKILDKVEVGKLVVCQTAFDEFIIGEVTSLYAAPPIQVRKLGRVINVIDADLNLAGARQEQVNLDCQLCHEVERAEKILKAAKLAGVDKSQIKDLYQPCLKEILEHMVEAYKFSY